VGDHQKGRTHIPVSFYTHLPIVLTNFLISFSCEVCDLWFLRAGNFTQHINSSSHIENERRKIRKSKSVQPTAINT